MQRLRPKDKAKMKGFSILPPEIYHCHYEVSFQATFKKIKINGKYIQTQKMRQETLKREVGASGGKSGFIIKYFLRFWLQSKKKNSDTVHTGTNQRPVCCEAEMIERSQSYTFILHIILFLVSRFRCSHSSSEMRNKS